MLMFTVLTAGQANGLPALAGLAGTNTSLPPAEYAKSYHNRPAKPSNIAPYSRRPQSLWERVGRAVLCTPNRRPGRAAACRGLPALPSVTDPLPSSPVRALDTATGLFLKRRAVRPACPDRRSASRKKGRRDALPYVLPTPATRQLRRHRRQPRRHLGPLLGRPPARRPSLHRPSRLADPGRNATSAKPRAAPSPA